VKLKGFLEKVNASVILK